MTTTALVSGGKDSLYAAYLAESQGRPVDELLTIVPSDPDAWMFHTPNLDWVGLQARAWGKPHRTVPVDGTGESAELAALKKALRGKSGWIVAGAIASSFQWARLLRVAEEVGRPVYAPLWRVDERRVVREEIDAGLDARLVRLAAEPLPDEWLGRRLDGALLAELEHRSRTQRRLSVAGEGGEFETLVVDAPFFRARIAVDRHRVERRGSSVQLVVEAAHLEPHRVEHP